MARFDRKVERTKKSFEFTQKEKIVETNKDVFKKNFTFKWVQLNIKTVCVFLVDFLLVTLLIIPFMMQYLNHGFAKRVAFFAYFPLLILWLETDLKIASGFDCLDRSFFIRHGIYHRKI